LLLANYLVLDPRGREDFLVLCDVDSSFSKHKGDLFGFNVFKLSSDDGDEEVEHDDVSYDLAQVKETPAELSVDVLIFVKCVYAEATKRGKE